MNKLTHLDKKGNPKMVDVGHKQPTHRRARVSGRVNTSKSVLELIRKGEIAKGDPLVAARIAGIMAAKNTSHLIPLCHNIPLNHVDVICTLCAHGVKIESEVRAFASTGVEMEALTAAAVAALTIYDMCKAVDPEMMIGDICLIEKEGGRSGHFQRKTSHMQSDKSPKKRNNK
jgi:cyclic pyranopterin monophosphate synthase